MLRLPEETGEEMRVAVALGVLERDVQVTDKRPARGGQVSRHVPVIVLVDRYGCGGVRRGDEAYALLHTRLPHGPLNLLGDRDEFVAIVRIYLYLSSLHSSPSSSTRQASRVGQLCSGSRHPAPLPFLAGTCPSSPVYPVDLLSVPRPRRTPHRRPPSPPHAPRDRDPEAPLRKRPAWVFRPRVQSCRSRTLEPPRRVLRPEKARPPPARNGSSAAQRARRRPGGTGRPRSAACNRIRAPGPRPARTRAPRPPALSPAGLSRVLWRLACGTSCVSARRSRR